MAKRYKNLDLHTLVEGVLHGDVPLLSRAITLVESRKPEHRALAAELIEQCLPHTGQARRIGISGSPGVGKSSFIEALGEKLLAKHEKLAVLTIDPSSQITKGSILGDKTRMEQLSRHKHAYIRPSASGDTLGGVARNTKEAMLLCEAAGYKHIIIETVGVGQSEIAVRKMVDCFLLLLLPGAGDDLQGIKKGIMEIADMVLINKCDGENKSLAAKTVGFYASALHLMRAREDHWTVPVHMMSALSGEGLDKVMDLLDRFFQETAKHIAEQRKEQHKYWFEAGIQESLQQIFFETPGIKDAHTHYLQEIHEQRMSAFQAVDALISLFKNTPK